MILKILNIPLAQGKQADQLVTIFFQMYDALALV